MRALPHLLLECLNDVVGALERDYFPFKMKVGDDEIHLKKAMNWLIRSIKNDLVI